ncbi:MAG: TonB-dependent receptor [Gammaproteobacteria bacterium]|nr:TonB-dependent receptor [Gammaproteobacteria bacterium]
MRGSIPGKRKTITSAIILATISLQTSAQQNAPEVEEVIVTGSYIRGTPLDAPSPVTTVDRASIEAQGAAQIWDVIKNMEINSGSFTNEGSGEGTGLSGTANVNLRNLGENSTLTLINGKRQVSAATTTRSGGEFVDINTIPLVMVDRVEVLTDGGSALYGSDAVAGVVNVIMRTQFEGLELYGDLQAMDSARSQQDKTGSAIWGWASDNGDTHFVLSAEKYVRDPVKVKYGNFYDVNSEHTGVVGGIAGVITATMANPAFGSRINPAYINSALTARNIAEGGASNLVLTDPLCSQLTAADGRPFFTGTRTEQRGVNTGNCREFTEDWTYMTVGTERDSFAGAFNHTFSEKAEFYSFFQYSDSSIERADSGANASRGPTVFLAAPGSHAGNPAYGGYGIGMTAELGYYAAKAGLTRPTSIPNAPNALANGGMNVPFYASVQRGNAPRQGGNSNMTETQTLGGQAGLRGDFEAFNDRQFNYDVSYSWSATSFEQMYQTFQRDRAELAANGLGGPGCTPNGISNFNFRDEPGPAGGLIPTVWNASNNAYYNGYTQTFFPGFVFTTRESLSLALTSNNHGQGGCMFYNPFLTQMTNPNLANNEELMEWMNPTVMRTDKRNKLGVLDAVVSGEIMELAGGMAQFAAGAQYRMQNNKSRAPYLNVPGLPNRILNWGVNGAPNTTHYVSNNYECSYCAFTYDNDRNVKAVFGELSLPFIDNVETQLAIRYEDYGGNIGGELTPKIAMSWRPVETLLLRASFSQSFRAPNVGVVEEGLESSNNTFRDPLRNQAVRAGMLEVNNANALPNFTYTLGGPAPDVGNEYADTFGTGFIWTPGGALEGLSVNADIWRFELTDKVLPQPGISAIADELELFKQAAANPANYVLNGTIPASRTGAWAAMDQFTPCDPRALEAQYGNNPNTQGNPGGVTGYRDVQPGSRLDCVVNPAAYRIDGVVRTFGVNTGALTTTVLSTINAGTIVADGIDLKLAYNWQTDFGRFRAGLDYTHVRQYRLIDVPGLELGLLETGVFDAAGTTGDGNLVRSLPDNKGNISLSWMNGNHGASVITRLIGSYRDLNYENLFATGNDNVRALVAKQIDSYQSWDIQYNYTHQWANDRFGTTIFTIGALDAFNADLPFREVPTREDGAINYDAGVFDGRGRRLYARVLMQL